MTTRIYWTDARTGGQSWHVTETESGAVVGRGPLVATGRTESGAPTVTYRDETTGDLRTVTYGGARR